MQAEVAEAARRLEGARADAEAELAAALGEARARHETALRLQAAEHASSLERVRDVAAAAAVERDRADSERARQASLERVEWMKERQQAEEGAWPRVRVAGGATEHVVRACARRASFAHSSGRLAARCLRASCAMRSSGDCGSPPTYCVFWLTFGGVNECVHLPVVAPRGVVCMAQDFVVCLRCPVLSVMCCVDTVPATTASFRGQLCRPAVLSAHVSQAASPPSGTTCRRQRRVPRPRPPPRSPRCRWRWLPLPQKQQRGRCGRWHACRVGRAWGACVPPLPPPASGLEGRRVCDAPCSAVSLRRVLQCGGCRCLSRRPLDPASALGPGCRQVRVRGPARGSAAGGAACSACTAGVGLCASSSVGRDSLHSMPAPACCDRCLDPPPD
jgi:hypothetical protein